MNDYTSEVKPGEGLECDEIELKRRHMGIVID